ncbi:MAG: hypothetical protein U0229_00945 [Anaeromyxobacter sp.]
MNRILSALSLALPLALLVGCTDPAKLPAESALAAAKSAIATLDAEAQKYAPDQVSAVKAAFSGAEGLVAKKDYKGALAQLEPIPGKVKEAIAAAAAKKDQLVAAWKGATADLPSLVGALKSRLSILAESKKLPKGLDAATVASAKEGLAGIESTFSKATADFQAGNLEPAIAAVKGLVPKGQEIMKSLGMQVPGAQ